MTPYPSRPVAIAIFITISIHIHISRTYRSRLHRRIPRDPPTYNLLHIHIHIHEPPPADPGPSHFSPQSNSVSLSPCPTASSFLFATNFASRQSDKAVWACQYIHAVARPPRDHKHCIASMASTITEHPAALYSRDTDRDTSAPRDSSPSLAQDRFQQNHLPDTIHLSPSLSRVNSDSVSPAGDHFETPAASISTVSHYQSSDFSDLDEDPFFGANFNNLDGQGPSFLDSSPDWRSDFQQGPLNTTVGHQSDLPFTSLDAIAQSGQHASNNSALPMTPDQTASIHTTSPHLELHRSDANPPTSRPPASISPRELQKAFQPLHAMPSSSQLTPSQSSSGRSSEDGQPPVPAVAMRSPRVTVSDWGNGAHVRTMETFDENLYTALPGPSSAEGNLGSHSQQVPTSVPQDPMGSWRPEPPAARRGLDPTTRPSDEVPSIKDLSDKRETAAKNTEIGSWVTKTSVEASVPQEEAASYFEQVATVDDGIPLGDTTENKYVSGQLYYTNGGGPMTDVDYDLIAQNTNWGDAPRVHAINRSTRHQPQSSQAAIERFNREYRDTDSILSRAATWGTRRRSISEFDIENVTSGGILKKLSISRGTDKGNRSSSIFKDIQKDLQNLVRPSTNQLRKRQRSVSSMNRAQAPQAGNESPTEKPESSSHLSLPPRTSSWGKKAPSISDAIMSMGSGAASIGGSPHHHRSGSISGSIAEKSPRSPRLSVNLDMIRRPRSRSELPRAPATMPNETPGLVNLLRMSGGPPVPALNRAPAAEVAEDEDDDEDDLQDDGDMQTVANLIDGIKPNFAGFQEHILLLNPTLRTSNSHLVDRIAHQQTFRYKHLLKLKVEHLGIGANCPCGPRCLALGGSAKLLDSKGIDPLSTQLDDEDGGLAEGAISQESFPADIPMPPTESLPAEFECQLCYSCKKFQKPSDWTKHVHEDVQPFTCTWDKCREPKMFKRKADWVRHENEGHRHLEWWTCNVDDCRHTCYRRDNFLQHLVREHKFSEPKVKTKAAVKKAAAVDPTWQKVEQCHVETSNRPQDEPCRFCGKTFPTWKKLTVHLAKHMEQMSLPVLRLVAAKAKELTADTIISPVQDIPLRQIPLPGEESTPTMPWPSSGPQHHPIGTFPPQQPYPDMYSLQQQYYTHTFSAPNQQQPMPAVYGTMNQPGFDATNQGLANLPVTTAPYGPSSGAYMPAAQEANLEPFPAFDNALHLQNAAPSAMGPQMGAYEAMMAPSSGHASPFSGQGSVSPFSRSPHQNAVNHGSWDERHVHGFMS